MRKICKDYLDNANPYDLKKTLLISSVFLIIGFLFLFTYKNIWLRYGLIIILIVIAVIKHNLIINFIKKFIEMKKSK